MYNDNIENDNMWNCNTHLNCNTPRSEVQSVHYLKVNFVAIGWHLNIFGRNWLTFCCNSKGGWFGVLLDLDLLAHLFVKSSSCSWKSSSSSWKSSSSSSSYRDNLRTEVSITTYWKWKLPKSLFSLRSPVHELGTLTLKLTWCIARRLENTEGHA